MISYLSSGGVDYDSINMAVTYSAINGLNQTIPLTIRDDETVESTETLTLSATNILNNQVASTVVNLLDDDRKFSYSARGYHVHTRIILKVGYLYTHIIPKVGYLYTHHSEGGISIHTSF